jgi:pimeloyl-ACP methyl ester carboxylesterase
MKLRRALAGAAGAVGGVALANRLLSTDESGVEPFLGAGGGTYRWRGFDVRYAEAGDPDDPDLILLHGINAAGSSHEFHTLFDRLAEEYHVLAPDLPGFGLSDRPPLVYTGALLEGFVEDFLADLSEEPTVVASSLTGAYAAEAASEVPVAELVLVCPTDTSMGERRPLVRSVVRSPVRGEALFNLIVSRRGLRYFHADHGYYDTGNLPDAVVDYEHAISHLPGARYAPASFVAGYLDPEADLGETLAGLDVPVTLVWGREADITPLSEGERLAETADARLVVFDRSRLRPHIEHPEQFSDVLRGEYESAAV